MKIIAKPKKEKTILVAVKADAKPKDIHKGIIEKAESCVVHLCGCNCGC